MSNKEPNETILRKVQKALNLANNAGATPEEAQNVLLAAQKLAIQHGIDMEAAGASPTVVNRKILHVEVKGEGLECWWRDKLNTIIANNFRCESYRSSTGVFRGKNYFIYKMTGFDEDIAIAREVYAHAERAVLFHAREYIKKMGRRILAKNKAKFKNEYIKGFLDGLSVKFRNQVEREEWGLVLVKDALVLQETASMTKYKLGEPDTVSADGNAYGKGFRTGRDYVFPAGSLE